jgi:hypothetical protein
MSGMTNELTTEREAVMSLIRPGRTPAHQGPPASFSSSICDMSPEIIAQRDYAAVCTELAAHLRLEAPWSPEVVMGLAWRRADRVIISARCTVGPGSVPLGIRPRQGS